MRTDYAVEANLTEAVGHEGVGHRVCPPCTEREFFIDNLLVRIHLIIVMIRWTGLSPCGVYIGYTHVYRPGGNPGAKLKSPTDATRFWWRVGSRNHRFAHGLPPAWGARSAQVSWPANFFFFFFFINLQPLKKLSTTNYAPFALDSEPGSLTDILRPS